MVWPRAARSPFCMPRLLVAAVVAVWLSPAAFAQIYIDDFNDGNDTLPAPAWGRYDPLAGVGNAPSTWSFPNGNTYRIQAATSTVPAAGTARAGSFRTDVSYTSFSVAAEVVSFGAINQSFGLGARVGNIGLQTTNGYFLAYDPTGTPSFDIYRITDEGVTSVGTLDFTLDPTHRNRLVFTGNGSSLIGQAFDLTANSGPLFTLSATDATYTSGFSGFIGASNAGGTPGPSDTTWDNFRASPVPEPGSWALITLGAAGFGVWRRQRKAKV